MEDIITNIMKMEKKIDTELTINSSGTSFATPLVSGVAALVEQKFPFLKGSQIADVILTTANTNVTLPELIVTKNVGKTGTANFYSVFYITKDVPKNGNDVNLDQVKQDLINAGFKTSDSDSTIAKYIIDNLLKSNADVSSNDKTYPISVVKLSKEEIIGSGILDAQKALKGLAAININRLNPNDIQEFDDGNGVKKYYAFYTIDTKGQNGGFAFTNDIDEIKWNEKYHLNDAINSLKSDSLVNTNLSTLEAGFIKTGNGTLKFSENTLRYNGPTISRGGALELHNVTAENTALYADKGGKILIFGDKTSVKKIYMPLTAVKLKSSES